MLFKAGVKVNGIDKMIILAFEVIDNVCYKLALREPTCTSVLDGIHKKGSKHFTGEACDIRMNDLPKQAKERFYRAVKGRLEPLGFDVVWEGKETPNEHLHVEWDPKEGE